MANAVSLRSWSLVKSKGARNFLRQKMLMAEQKSGSDAGNTIGGPNGIMSALQHEPPRLWKPVRLVYSEPLQQRLAVAHATANRKTNDAVTERLEKRCGLGSTAAPWHVCHKCNGIDEHNERQRAGGVYTLPPAGMPTGQQREQQIQTEDIQDQQFLSNALEKCNTGTSAQHQIPCQSHLRSHSASSNRSGCSNRSDRSIHSMRSNQSIRSNHSNCSTHSRISNASMHTQISKADSHASIDTLVNADSGNNKTNGSQPKGCPAPLPDGDNLSIRSTASKHSHKLRTSGGQEVVQLPDQNTQHVCSKCNSNRIDADCISLRSNASRVSRRSSRVQQRVQAEPVVAGYRKLSEQERLQALETFDCRYKKLIEDYNRLPVTEQTLRVRNRKRNIEKELDAIESEINRYSKSIVYMPNTK